MKTRVCVCVSLLGECVLALKSMIGSTAQQFHTYLSHRGEETGNIRGSMRVRVPSERMGTRERLYGKAPSMWMRADSPVLAQAIYPEKMKDVKEAVVTNARYFKL